MANNCKVFLRTQLGSLDCYNPAKALTTSRRQEMKMKKRFVLELSEEEAQTLCEALGDHAESDLERIGIESEGRWFLKKLVEKLNDWL